MNITPFSKTYGGRIVLDFPGMNVQPATIYTVIGANGCGKSTFAKVLAGILPSDQKRPVLDTASVGYMPQQNVAFRMSTKANLLLNGGDRARAERLMDDLRLTHLADTPARRLSGGETARMALARLMMRPYALLILDEPTAAMDIETTQLAEQCIARYVQTHQCALLLITHSLQQARRLADHVLYFNHGHLTEIGPANILTNPQTFALQQFLDFYGA